MMENFGFYLLISIALSMFGVRGDETKVSEAEDGVDPRCAIYGGNYVRRARCCKGKFISFRTELYFFGKEFRNCLKDVSESPENKDDDLPPLMWKAYICVLKSTSAFPDGELSFQAYVNHMTSNYTDAIKTEVRSANLECPQADRETDDWKKVMRFAECFFRNEKNVCHHPTQEYLEKTMNNSLTSASKGIEIVAVNATCTPLEGTFTPYDDCCQKTPLPIPLKSLLNYGLLHAGLMHGVDSLNLPEIKQCSSSFIKRQAELIQEKTGTSVGFANTCMKACCYTRMIYNGSDTLFLNETGLQLDYYVKSLLPETFPGKFTEISQKQRTRVVHIGNNKTMSFNQLVEKFKETDDELEKISMYCLYYRWLTILMELTFREYCTDAEWMKNIVWNIK